MSVNSVKAQKTIEAQLGQLTEETQIFISGQDQIMMLWWIPSSFWKLSLQMDPSLNEYQIEEFLSLVNNYIIVAVLDGSYGPSASVNYKDYQSIKDELFLFHNQQRVLSLDQNKDNINRAVLGLLELFRPSLANLLGPMGEHMYFYLFDNSEKQKVLKSEIEVGKVSLVYKESIFEWILPFEALTPSKSCLSCGSVFPGNYNYCPFDAKILRK